MKTNPQSKGWNPKFDLDLAYGQAGERWLLWLGQPDAKVEVKTERDTWRTTGNVCFEYQCREKPSGVATTQADWWVHLLASGPDIVGGYVFAVPQLKTFLRAVWHKPATFNARLAIGGDDSASVMLLVPIASLHLIHTTR